MASQAMGSCENTAVPAEAPFPCKLSLSCKPKRLIVDAGSHPVCTTTTATPGAWWQQPLASPPLQAGRFVRQKVTKLKHRARLSLPAGQSQFAPVSEALGLFVTVEGQLYPLYGMRKELLPSPDTQAVPGRASIPRQTGRQKRSLLLQ